MYINLQNIRIILDDSVKHISQKAAMALSGSIENGILFSGTDSNVITIFNDRIDFGPCYSQELQGFSGNFFPNFYIEYGRVVYRFGNNIKCSMFSKTLEYKGLFAPSEPDNSSLYSLIYPKYA